MGSHAQEGQMPFTRVPHDAMRDGLPGAKAGVTHLGKHPVQIIQEQVRPSRSPPRRASRAPDAARRTNPNTADPPRLPPLPPSLPPSPRPPHLPLSPSFARRVPRRRDGRRQMLANTYGIAMPARMDIEAQFWRSSVASPVCRRPGSASTSSPATSTASGSTRTWTARRTGRTQLCRWTCTRRWSGRSG